MRELDDFDWVDHTSSRSPDQPDSPGTGQSRGAPQSRGPRQSRGPVQSSGAPRPYGVGQSHGAAQSRRVAQSRGETQSRGSAQSGGSTRSGGSGRSGNGGGSRKIARSRGSVWARIAAGLRAFAGWVRRLPRPVLIAAGALVALVVLSMVIDSALYYNKVHAGVNVSDQGLGGLTQDEAVVALTELVENTRDMPITLVHEDNKVRDVLPDEVGLVVDVPATAVAALDMTRKSNFIVDLAQRLRLYFNGEDLSLVGTVDEEKLAALVAAVAEQLDTPPVNDGLQVDSSLSFTVVKGNKGFVVNQDALREQLTEMLLTLHATELRVPMMVKEPDVTAQDFDTALSQVQTMVTGNLQLMNGDQTLGAFTPGQIAAYLDFTSEDRDGVMTLVPHLSPTKMSPFFAGIAPLFAVPAVDAGFGSDSELRSAWVVPGTQGRALDPQGTADALTTAALSTTSRAAQVVTMAVDPDLTTEEAQAMGIKDMLASYQTEYFTTPERAQNVIMATQYAGGKLLAPGEEYNTDQQIGPRTVERGFVLAIGITNPGEYEDVLGGGICQVSTTLFNAVMYAGLEITERWNHSIYIDHYPLGLDATVTASSKNPKNLRFKNNTDHYILIQGWSDGGHTRFSIYGTDDGRKSTMVASDFFDVVPCTLEPEMRSDSSLGIGTTEIAFPGQSEMKVLVTRTVTWPSGSTTTDTFVSTWGTLRQVIKVGTSTTTTLAPVGTTTATTVPPAT